MYKLVAAILLGNGVSGRMATAPHYSNIHTCMYIACLVHCRCHFLDLLSNSFCCKWKHCCITFGSDYTYHISSYVAEVSGLSGLYRCGCSADLLECCGKRVHVQSVGQERNVYRHSLLWLVQFETKGKCLSLCCKGFFL